MAEEDEQDALLHRQYLPITKPEDVLIDDFLQVQDVRVSLDEDGDIVEVRAETPVGRPSLWKSLRYRCHPERAPRVYDTVRVVVVVYNSRRGIDVASLPLARETVTFKTETSKMPPGPVCVPTQPVETLAEQEPASDEAPDVKEARARGYLPPQ